MAHNSREILKDILFVDIETVSCVDDYDALNDDLRALWDKKAMSIRKEPTQQPRDLFFEQAGIYAEFGKIIVIGLGFVTFDEQDEPTLRTKALKGHDERALLLEFSQLLESGFSQKYLKLCAHNGKEFDFPYLCRRMLVHGISLPPVLSIAGKKPWEVSHLDTMDLWKFGDRKNFTSLHLLATLFGIPSSKEIMEGHEVNHYYYKKNDLDNIANYCAQDVVVMVQIFLKMHCWPLIPPERIVLI